MIVVAAVELVDAVSGVVLGAADDSSGGAPNLCL
jgi:hypothetical protein